MVWYRYMYDLRGDGEGGRGRKGARGEMLEGDFKISDTQSMYT